MCARLKKHLEEEIITQSYKEEDDDEDQAIDFIKGGLEVALELNADRITCAPLNDGYDYSFQVDYRRVWDYTVSSFKTAAQHNRNVTLSIEYKPSASLHQAPSPTISILMTTIENGTGASSREP